MQNGEVWLENMFKGLAGLKKAVKGGFSVVAETSSQLAEQVVGDPSTSKDNLKESIKKKVRISQLLFYFYTWAKVLNEKVKIHQLLCWAHE